MVSATIALVLAALPLAAQVTISRGPESVRIDVDGKPFTSFVYGPKIRKPYFDALRSASGVLVTRHVPIDAKAGDSTDHIHQNGVWFAHGDVDGMNFWATEPSQVVATTGSIVVRSIPEARGGFTAELEWLDPAGRPLIQQSLSVAVTADARNRYLDFDTRLRGIRPVTFRDSTEGIFAIRTASWLEQNHGGKLTCPSGEGESACWGRTAPWVDFSGVHDGQSAGIAVMQHPASLRYPGGWHVRAYGLLAANPFGTRHFYDERVKKGWDKNAGDPPPAGDLKLGRGETARFRYRVVVHSGPVNVAELQRRYAAPELVFDRLPPLGGIAFNAAGQLFARSRDAVIQIFGAAASQPLGPGVTAPLIPNAKTVTDCSGGVFSATGNQLKLPDGSAHTLPGEITGLAFGAADPWSLWIAEASGRIYRIPVAQPAAATPKGLRVIEPRDGDVLNSHDGIAVPGGLRISVRGELEGDGPVTVNGAPAKVADGWFSSDLVLTKPETRIVVQGGGAKQELTVLWNANSTPRYRMSVDDNIEWLKDIALHTPAYQSIFDNPYLAFWREMHRKYGAKVHFNIYYQTRGFNLSQMPVRYKDEWRRNADWIRLSFHARANDPDRPYVHASAEQIANDFRLVNAEIERFAGRELLSDGMTTIHWGETSPQAIEGLRKAGVRMLAGYFELRRDLPAVSYDLPIDRVQHLATRDAWKDTRRGLMFVRIDSVLNDANLQVVPRLEQLAADPHQSELLELMIHEEHWYPNWPGYRPDYKERVEQAIRWATEHGYRSVLHNPDANP